MSTVTITLQDTPTGGVSIGMDFVPAIGQACTPAQAEALDILTRTRKSWGSADKPTSQAITHNPTTPGATL